MTAMKPAYATVSNQRRLTPKEVQTELWDAVWKSTVYRAKNFGECHSREGLPQVIYELLGRCHRTVRLAVAAAVIERDRKDGQLDLVMFSNKAGQIVARSIVDDLPDEEAELQVPLVPWGD